MRTAGGGWGSVLKVAQSPGVANTSLRASVTAGGSFILAWDAADVRESQPTRLIAGTAQRRPGSGWRAYALENARLAMNGGFVAESAQAVPLVTGNGAIAITWTGAAHDNTLAGVKAARLTSKGLRAAQVVSGSTENAAVGDASVGPSGQAAIVWSQVDAQNRTSTYAALSPGPGVPFAAPDLLTPVDATGISGPAVAFQPVSGQPVAIVPIVQDGSGGFVSAVRTP